MDTIVKNVAVNMGKQEKNAETGKEDGLAPPGHVDRCFSPQESPGDLVRKQVLIQLLRIRA